MASRRLLISGGVCLATLTLLAQEPPQQTVGELKAAPGLAVTLWASEPDLTNPTNIAIYERGRPRSSRAGPAGCR